MRTLLLAVLILSLLGLPAWAVPLVAGPHDFKGEVVEWIHRGEITFSRCTEGTSMEAKIPEHYIVILKGCSLEQEKIDGINLVSKAIGFLDPILTGEFEKGEVAVIVFRKKGGLAVKAGGTLRVSRYEIQTDGSGVFDATLRSVVAGNPKGDAAPKGEEGDEGK